MTDPWNIALSGINLALILKILFNDLKHLQALLERHLDFSESLHRETERRLSHVESRLLAHESSSPGIPSNPGGSHGDPRP